MVDASTSPAHGSGPASVSSRASRTAAVQEWIGTNYGRVARVGRGLVHPPSQRTVVVPSPERDGVIGLPGGRFTGMDTIAVQLLRGTYEETTRKLLTHLVKPGMTFVDIGANIGYFTVLGGLLTGSTGHVIAFEPEPSNFALLADNVRRNGLHHVELLQAACAATDGESFLRVNPTESGWHRLEESAQADSNHVAVRIVRPDAVLATQGLVPDVIKIDVEGHEASALAGMSGVLGTNPDLAVVIEHAPGQAASAGHAPMAALELLWDAGLSHTYLIDEHSGRVDPVSPTKLTGASLTSRSENLLVSGTPLVWP